MTLNGKSSLAETMQALEAAVSAAPLAEIPCLLGSLERLKALSWSRMVMAPQHEQREATGKNNLTAQDVAPILNVKPSMVYELVRTKRLKAYKVGKYIRFKESSVQDFLADGGA